MEYTRYNQQQTCLSLRIVDATGTAFEYNLPLENCVDYWERVEPQFHRLEIYKRGIMIFFGTK